MPTNWKKLSKDIFYLVVFLAGLIAGSSLTAIPFNEFLNTLDFWAKLAEVATGIAVSIAVLSFIYQREQDRNTQVIDLLGFFRKEIIPLSRKIEERSVFLLSTYNISRPLPKIIEFDIGKFRKTNPAEFNLQLQLRQARSLSDRFDVMDLLNMLEEFALRIFVSDATGDETLNSTKNVFASCVEKNILEMLDLSTLSTNGSFPGIKKLYENWKI